MGDKVILYSDGSCQPNPGLGSYAAVAIIDGVENRFTKKFDYTTNNRMELLGIIEVLELFDDKKDVLIYTDSKYVTEAINNKWIHGWNKKGYIKIANPDLWKRMWNVFVKHELSFKWVKGHADNRYNNICDEMALESRKSMTAKVHKDKGYNITLNTEIRDKNRRYK